MFYLLPFFVVLVCLDGQTTSKVTAREVFIKSRDTSVDDDEISR